MCIRDSYQDETNDMIVALLSANDDFDYFGYMKKMVLTLHNVQKINHRELPIHGAMVKMTLHNGCLLYTSLLILSQNN